MRLLTFFLLTFLALPSVAIVYAQAVDVSTFGAEPDTGKNSTSEVARAIAFAIKNHRSLVTFPRGRYDFWPEEAVKRRLFISNHDDVEERSVVMPIEHADRLTVDGGGSEFVFHDSVLPIAIAYSKFVDLRHFSIDYQTQRLIQAKVIGGSDAYVDLKIDDKESYAVKSNHIYIHAEKYEEPAKFSLVFDSLEKGLAARTGDNWSFFQSSATLLKPGVIRVMGLESQPRTGEVLVLWNGNRPNPAILIDQSAHVSVSAVTVHSAQGMGLIAQKSAEIHLDGFSVALKPNSGRYVTTIADAVHFSNCRGQLTVENGLFENMLDDGINVHGSYLRVTGHSTPNTVSLEFGHPQTFGLPFAAIGETVRFVHRQTLEPYATAKVVRVSRVDDKHLELRLDSDLPSSLEPGDGVENLNWRPRMLYRNNHIRHNRARGTLFGSEAVSTVIENNFFDYLSGPAILFSADASSWFENAPAHNVTIRHNRFLDTNMGPFGPAPIVIDLPFKAKEDSTYFSVRNIRIENNQFEEFQDSLLYATSVEGLIFRHNTVVHNQNYPPSLPLDSPVFYLNHARCIDITDNSLADGGRTAIYDSFLINAESVKGTFNPTGCGASFKPLAGEHQ
ncbi:right-handed parallel beta-helix repeat-containing protein [Granulicella mallensis]|uniref:Alpha-1,3-galactosidase B n=1 Tax=Granulicella mallensis TaxID=940614 RepID=A0A7W7ZL54_9BACT|nr:right-handed parallel beta-helix repeat-containing protein [Granulicella mallensis]MBB5061927.1 hypothetical protein [Granulicella mallensis]